MKLSAKRAVVVAALAALAIVLTYMALKRYEHFQDAAAKPTLYYFFMPGCPHCENFEPIWGQLENATDLPPVTLQKVDGTEAKNSALVEKFKVEGFPTIVLDKEGKAIPYEGARDAASIIAWLKESA